MVAVTQMMFIDFYEFHARQNPQSEVSALTASVMRRFIDLLERGDYRKNREVGYYADKLCVTPKYLSEVCKKVSGFSANSWINRYAAIELVHLLKDKSLSLTDIAYMFDFSSPSHFSRFYRTIWDRNRSHSGRKTAETEKCKIFPEFRVKGVRGFCCIFAPRFQNIFKNDKNYGKICQVMERR